MSESDVLKFKLHVFVGGQQGVNYKYFSPAFDKEVVDLTVEYINVEDVRKNIGRFYNLLVVKATNVFADVFYVDIFNS